MSLQGKVALITGAGNGMGRATAMKLSAEGAAIACLDMVEEDAAAAAAEIESNGGAALPLVCNVSCPEQVLESINKVIERFGRLDVVFANAGINGLWAPLEELTPEAWDKTINVNLKGTFLTIKYAAPHLKKQGGSVIITSSINGTRIFSNTGATAYSCSKAGQVAMAKMLALELGRFKIRVNAICPGGIRTNIGVNSSSGHLEGIKFPVEWPEGKYPLEGHAGSGEQIADVVCFLASDASSHITGTVLYVDGGESLLQG